jgi:hypothetical protein
MARWVSPNQAEMVVGYSTATSIKTGVTARNYINFIRSASCTVKICFIWAKLVLLTIAYRSPSFQDHSFLHFRVQRLSIGMKIDPCDLIRPQDFIFPFLNPNILALKGTSFRDLKRLYSKLVYFRPSFKDAMPPLCCYYLVLQNHLYNDTSRKVYPIA